MTVDLIMCLKVGKRSIAQPEAQTVSCSIRCDELYRLDFERSLIVDKAFFLSFWVSLGSVTCPVGCVGSLNVLGRED